MGQEHSPNLADGTERALPLANELAYAWARVMVGLYRTDGGNFFSSLVQQQDCVARAKSSFNQDCTVDPRRAIVGLGDLPKDHRIGLAGIGVQRDHLASRIALQNVDHGFGSNAKRAAEKRRLGEAARGNQIDVNVCPKASRLKRLAQLLA